MLKRYLPGVATSSLVFCLLVFLLTHRAEDRPGAVPARCRDLADHPGRYNGLIVRVSTSGTEPDGEGRAVWRRTHPGPVLVVVLFPPEDLGDRPAEVVGPCRWPVDGPVVVDGRPER